MRLIDADALFINLDGMMEVSPTGYIHGDTVADMISDAPTVEAVPVVRCKDCKWFSAIGYCDLLRFRIVDSYKYCAWAERRNDETD